MAPLAIRTSLLLVATASCSAEAEPHSAAAGCRVLQPSKHLPDVLGESSGVAASRRHSGILWTHNDSGGDAEIFAIRADGTLVGRTEVKGAKNEDWEDVAIGPCPGGDCLYLADTGDNDGDREDAALYRVPEPAPGAASARAERFPVRYPEGHPDVEAIFVLSPGTVYLVSKGTGGTETLYRYPLPMRAGVPVALERVAELGVRGGSRASMVTGSSASGSGRWVAIRKYGELSIHRARELVAGQTRPALRADLSPVGEAQGEAVALLDNGRVVLTSEGGSRKAPGTIAILQCDLPRD